MINIINFNKSQSQNLIRENWMNTENTGKNEAFINVLDNKIESMKLTDNNVQKKAEETDKGKNETDKSVPVRSSEEKENMRKTGSLSMKEKEEQAESIDKIKLGGLTDAIEQINLLLKQLKIIDLKLYKSNQKEYESIKKSIINVINNKSLKSEIIVHQLFQFLRKLKELVLSDKDKSGKGKEIIKNDKGIDIKKAGDDNGINKNVKLNDLDSAQSDKLMKKGNESFNAGNIKVQDNRKSSQINTAQEKNNNESILLKSKVNDIILNSPEIRNLQKNDLNIEIKENMPLRKADINELIQKVTGNIKIMLADNKNEIVMNLKPEFLGKVQIKLEFKGNTVSGKFIVDNIYAEKMFKDSMVQLKVNFQNMGLDVQNFDVAMNENRNFNLNRSLNDFQITNRGVNAAENKNENELLPSIVDNYESLGWIAQNVNMVI